MKTFRIFVVLIICSFTTIFNNTVQAENLSSTGQIISTLPCAAYINDMTTAIVPYAKQIPLTRGENVSVGYYDYDFLNQWKWHLHKLSHTCYAAKKIQLRSNKKSVTVLMHRLILNPPKGKIVDHQDHNGLNCEPHNIRICTYSQNQMNKKPKKNGTSKYMGVSLYDNKKGWTKWVAEIRINGKRLWQAYFKDEIEAAKSYDKKALKYNGEFANLNFPEINN